MPETVKLSLEFPRPFVEDMWDDETAASADAKQALILDLLRQHRISIRKGAEVLGLPYRDFLDLAARHHVSLVDCVDDDWLDRELAATRKTIKRDA